MMMMSKPVEILPAKDLAVPTEAFLVQNKPKDLINDRIIDQDDDDDDHIIVVVYPDHDYDGDDDDDDDGDGDDGDGDEPAV